MVLKSCHVFVLRQIARCLLYSMGWHPLTQEQLDFAEHNPRLVLIFPHTTYWDGILLLLYRMLHYEAFKDCYTFMHEGLFNQAPRLFTKLGFVAITKAETSNGGAIEQIHRKFTQKSNYKIIISPEGKLTASPWRSGYFYIAKVLDCGIWVIGADYEKRKLISSANVRIIGTEHSRTTGMLSVGSNDQSRTTGMLSIGSNDHSQLQTVEKDLKAEMSQIVPLHPSCSFIPVRQHDPHNLFAIDPVMVTSYIGPLSMAICSLYLAYIRSDAILLAISLITFVSAGASSHYHFHQESKEMARRLDIFMCLFCYLCHGLHKVSRVGLFYTYFYYVPFILHLITGYYFIKGMGRNQVSSRHCTYVCNHWKFHLAIGILGTYTVCI